MVIAKKWIYAKAFEGEPKLSDFKLEEEELPELKDGEFLVKGEYLSINAGTRAYMSILNFPIGSLVIGGQVAEILESKNEKYVEGSYVFGAFGWRSHTVVLPEKYKENYSLYPLPEMGKLSRSLANGALGMPGNTAYFGFLEICQPKSGETVVVSGAAGAVGSLVGQIAKIKGCNVIGIAGNDEKCNWLKEIGFDNTINYKTENISVQLKKAAPGGVDCYFDNVGGATSAKVLKQMNNFGRISVCGTVSNYSSGTLEQVEDPQSSFVFKQLKQEGFVVYRWADKWFEGISQMKKWIEEDKIKIRETVTEGFENIPAAFCSVLRGENIGKAVVKLL